MSHARRLERLEQEDGTGEWHVWRQDLEHPDVFHRNGRTLSLVDLEREPGKKILVTYEDTPLPGEKEGSA